MAYDGEANIAFDCPGHQGGQFYRKSPAGQLFFKHFGESIFRNDLCNADVDLGDLLIHEGPAAEAQRYAAQVFGADKTYFVLNGTSTSNKVVTNAVLRRGDLVLFDRNNHKSLHQGALVQAGAIPIFLPTARNPFGMIGAVDWDAWDEDYLREQIRDQPAREGPASGTRRSARSGSPASSSRPTTARSTTSARCWRRSAISATTCSGTRPGSATTPSIRCSRTTARCGSRSSGPEMPGLFSTQSVHKQGAGFSQASQIHKRDEHIRGQQRFIEHKRFNESFLMQRLDLAVLSAVRLARRERQDPRGQGRRDAVGPLHRARHRDPQEAPRVRPLLRAHRAERRGEVVLRSVRARRGDDSRLQVHRGRHGRRLGGPPDRGDQARAAVLELPSREQVARLCRLRRRLRDGRSQQAHAADARASIARPASTWTSACRRRSSPTTCASSASFRRSATSTASSS